MSTKQKLDIVEALIRLIAILIGSGTIIVAAVWLLSFIGGK